MNNNLIAYYTTKEVIKRDLDTNSKNKNLLKMGVIFNEAIDKAKIFNIDDDIDNILRNTKNKISFRKLPFDDMFLNNPIKISIGNHNMTFIGFLLSKVYNSDNCSEGCICCTNYYLDDLNPYSKHLDGLTFSLFDVAKSPKFHPSFNLEEVVPKEVITQLQEYIINFLDFINNP